MACRAISEENEMGRQQGIQESRELLTAFLGSVPEVREHVATEKEVRDWLSKNNCKDCGFAGRDKDIRAAEGVGRKLQCHEMDEGEGL